MTTQKDHWTEGSLNHSSHGGDEDFATLFAAQGMPQKMNLNIGDKVEARIVHMGAENAFCAVNAALEAVIAKTELVDERGRLAFGVGDTIEGFVVSLQDGVTLSRKISRDHVDVETLMHAANTALPVEGNVTGVNKGGLEVAIGGVRAFCPMGQVDVNFVEDPNVFVGKTLQFVVRQVAERGRNVVLSRKALLEMRQKEKMTELLSRLNIGDRVEGTVTRTAAFGAFVDIGGVEGLIPMSELSHAHVSKTEEVLSVGEKVTVEIRSIEQDPKRHDQRRIGLSLRATQPLPLLVHATELSVGSVHTGKVTRLEKFGAFVELFPGVLGLVHVSEITTRRLRHPGDELKVDQTVTVAVLSLDLEEQRLSLTIKGVNPPSAEDTKTAKPHEEDDSEAYLKSQNTSQSFGTLADLFKVGGDKKKKR